MYVHPSFLSWDSLLVSTLKSELQLDPEGWVLLWTVGLMGLVHSPGPVLTGHSIVQEAGSW